ncbi:hypothetical protein [Halomicrococcus sp. NG-SE-24]|uniref:hypothetical protein n=1 Tax=Halomicrococcus sp. NG-SE-24 TaxID=3436928 RepID=UPI003D98327A
MTPSTNRLKELGNSRRSALIFHRLRDTTIRNETLAAAIGQTNGSIETLTLENETISGIIIENRSV